jgi:hypothetical protein
MLLGGVVVVALLPVSNAPAAEPPEDLIFFDGFEPHPCDPDFGTHGTEAAALNLGTISDCNGAGLNVAGVLGTPQEADYSRFSGEDDFGCAVDPTLTLTATDLLRACLFFECVTDIDEFGCAPGTSASISPSGRFGCCQTGLSLTLSPQTFTCQGTGEDADVFIRLNSAAAACTSYTFNVHY